MLTRLLATSAAQVMGRLGGAAAVTLRKKGRPRPLAAPRQLWALVSQPKNSNTAQPHTSKTRSHLPPAEGVQLAAGEARVQLPEERQDHA